MLHILQEMFDRPLKNGFYENGANRDEITDKVDHFNTLEKHFPKTNHEVIKDYTSVGHLLSNTALWNSKLKNTPIDSETKESIKDLSNAINSTEPTSDNHTLYTGIRHANLKRNDLVHMPAFVSTSLSPSVAAHFSRGKTYFNPDENTMSIMKIQIRKGQTILNARDQAIHKREHEVILPANQVLKIKSTKVFHNESGQKIHVHTAQIMTPDEIEAHKDHPEVQSHLKMKQLLGI